MLTRRMFLFLLMSAVSLPALPVLASDDDDDGGDGHGGGGGGNSGPGGGDDDDDDDDRDDDDDLDQDRARRAVKDGEAIELRKVMASIRRKFGGRIVNVSLRRSGARLIYKIRLIDKDNRLLNLVVNARTGQIISGTN